MRTLFNDGWRFAKTHIENQNPLEDGKPVLFSPEDFYGRIPSDTDFTDVNVPHDWLIYDTKNLYENSVGFYKKDFELDLDSQKRYFLRFGGVYMNWAVWVNGKLACVWKYGYTTVEFEITDFVAEGKNSVLLIAVYQNPNTRWYSGAGIFRDVEFLVTEKSRINNDGIYFSACPEKENDFAGKWRVKIDTEILSPVDGMTVEHKIIFADGKELSLFDSERKSKVSKNPAPAMGVSFNHDENVLTETFCASVENPMLWDDENPNVYLLKTSLVSGGKTIDRCERQIGFRFVDFTDGGMFVNGLHVKIHGACMHHDLGILGAAFDLVAARRQLSRLKEMGVNAIRTSHNPQDESYLDLADRMGFYIDDDFFDMWEKPKTIYDYGNYFVQWHERDCSALVRRDRCHPSVIMWSVGNEIYDTHSGNGFEITKNLRKICRRFDPEKNAAVTIASNYMQWDGAQKCADETDVVGYNYAERLYDGHHKKNPAWKIYGSETSSTVQSRGVYHFPLSNRLLTCVDNQCSSLGNCSPSWGARDTSFVLSDDRDRDYSLGQFIWTGWDYIGEPTPYSTKNSYFGQIDTAGFPKDSFFLYKSVWNKKNCAPFVHLLPYWDFNEGQKIDVRVYSNLESVELFLNGRSLGKKSIDFENGKDLSATWESVVYEKGTLLAVGYGADGSVLAREEKKSFGDAKKIVLELEKESCGGLYFVDAMSVDSDGNPVENSRSRLEISVSGEAELVGADNGDSTDYEQYRSSDGKKLSRKLFSNRLLILVRSKNDAADFTVTASGAGLESCVLVFKNGKIDFDESEKRSGKIVRTDCDEIPIRKIDLISRGTRSLNQNERHVTVDAVIHPADATHHDLVWIPMMLEGVRSDSAAVDVEKTLDGERATVTALCDGDFRLACMADNGGKFSEIISELEFSVSGIGRSARNPFELIEACKCSASSDKIELSFNGGAFNGNKRAWFEFDKMDFGRDGADTFSVPIFSFDTELDFELWEGNPDGGRKIMDCHYSAASIYNTYQSKAYTLPRRLFGMHTLSLVFRTSLSFQGIEFEKSAKAFSKLSALDCSSLFGDSFVRTDDAVEKIGNNVVLEFDTMDFGAHGAKKITVCGFAHVDNTIHVKFSGETDAIQILEFKKTDGYVEKTFDIDGVPGMNKVAFVFLPGSNFDFRWFRFGE
ncbi:MAG: DUF4982 domain-containing protein [Treponema sp.]|nr:DUF4982 domain-containing protein [Treponema sp.]